MSVKRRLQKLEEILKRLVTGRNNPPRPLVIMWDNGTPKFRDQPTTKEQAIKWLQARSDLVTSKKDLVLILEDEKPPTVREYLIDKFNIELKDLEQ